ncbi:MAG: hypothetical protein HC831_30305 [Chloroflexia bacterium]|nr:hypothetical protein [Chloroflexia bacterium]
MTITKIPIRPNTNTEDSTKKENKVVKIDFAVLSAIPDPIETASLIKALELRYDKAALNSLDNKSKYATDYKRAVNLGVYSTDLGYANIYEKSQDAINLLVGVKDMADQLKIGQYFEFDKIKELAKSSDKLDELLRVTEENLQEVNTKLQESDRSDMTVLIITGGWIEVMYLATNVAQKKANKDLEATIAEQKVVLDQLVTLLNYYDSMPKMRSLHDELVEMDKIFEKVKVTYIKGDSKQTEKDGQLVIEQGERTEIEMSREILDEITAKIASIRNKIVS